MISGLVTTAASMPVDIVKTRWVIKGKHPPHTHPFNSGEGTHPRISPPNFPDSIQNMRTIDGKPEYRNGLVSKRQLLEGGCPLFEGRVGRTPSVLGAPHDLL